VTLQRVGLAVIIAFYLVFGFAYALCTPLWEVPDEPAHFNYVKHLAEGQGLPILQPGDWDAAYLERLKAAKFPPDLSIDAVRYESHQPPLYYMLATPVYLATRGLTLSQQVVALRLLSTALGAVLLVIVYATAGMLFPGDRLIALAVPAFVATIPQHIAMSAAMNNDTLAEVVLSATVLLLLLTMRDGLTIKQGVATGILLGLALLTKEVAYVSAVLAGGVAIWRWWTNLTPGPSLAREGKRTASPSFPLYAKSGKHLVLTSVQGKGVRGLGRTLLWLAGAYSMALAIAGWWFVRNAATYGGLDIFGRARHDAVVVGQPETAAWGLVGAAKHIVIVLFESFWAQFGWMGVLADDRTYTVFGVLSVLAALGFMLYLWHAWQDRASLSRFQWAGLGLLASTLLLVLLGLFQYNLKFMQPQGRYLFPVLVPLGLFFVLGLRELVTPRYQALIFILLYVYLLYVDYVCLTKFIVPALR